MKKKKKSCSNCNSYWKADSECMDSRTYDIARPHFMIVVPGFKCKYHKKERKENGNNSK